MITHICSNKKAVPLNSSLKPFSFVFTWLQSLSYGYSPAFTSQTFFCVVLTTSDYSLLFSSILYWKLLRFFSHFFSLTSWVEPVVLCLHLLTFCKGNSWCSVKTVPIRAFCLPLINEKGGCQPALILCLRNCNYWCSILWSSYYINGATDLISYNSREFLT